MPERTFNLYNKSGTKVASGKSPLHLLDLVEDTDYKKGDYTITAQEYSSESTPVDVPAFRTKASLKLTIEGVETTGTYLTKDISQADYLALATKDANTLYRVQPTDSGSGRVHFLGSQIVDLTKDKDGNVVYGRNLLIEKNIVIGKYPTWVTDDLASNSYRWASDFISVKEGDVISFAKLKSVGNGHNLIVKLYDANNNGVYLATSNLSSWAAPTGAGRNINLEKGTLPTIPSGVVKMRVGGLRDDTSLGVMSLDEVKSLGLKVIKGSSEIIGEYTPAPEDIILSVSTGGGTFG